MKNKINELQVNIALIYEFTISEIRPWQLCPTVLLNLTKYPKTDT